MLLRGVAAGRLGVVIVGRLGVLTVGLLELLLELGRLKLLLLSLGLVGLVVGLLELSFELGLLGVLLFTLGRVGVSVSTLGRLGVVIGLPVLSPLFTLGRSGRFPLPMVGLAVRF